MKNKYIVGAYAIGATDDDDKVKAVLLNKQPVQRPEKSGGDMSWATIGGITAAVIVGLVALPHILKG